MEEFYERFGDKNMIDLIEEFNKLKQVGSVLEYQTKFEEIKSLMVITNPTLSEAYFVSSFISGLSDEVRPTVKMLQPATVKQAPKNTKL